MEQSTGHERNQRRHRNISRRGAFYTGVGFSLLVGMLIVVGLGVLGVSSLGWFTLSTAMAMIGLSIGLLGVVAFISLMSMRRTLNLLNSHEQALTDQADRHAALAKKVADQRHAAQYARDREQDRVVANLSDRQDASSIETEQLSERFHSTKQGPVDPFEIEGAEIHPVEDVEGIGKEYAKRLKTIGITDTRELWYADAMTVATKLDIAPVRVRDWQSMSELMALEGVGKQYAELLVRADVASIPELSAQNPKTLQSRIQKLEGRVKKRVQGNTIKTKSVENWIDAAESHHNGKPQATAPGSSRSGE